MAPDDEEQQRVAQAEPEEQEEGSSGQEAMEKTVLSVQETTSKPMDIFEGERFDAVAFINRLFPDGMRAGFIPLTETGFTLVGACCCCCCCSVSVFTHVGWPFYVYMLVVRTRT